MGDSINNFFNLLFKGDFFLIFLIVMMVIIIGVIVYLVRLQITDTSYEDYDDDDVPMEDDDDYVYNVKSKRDEDFAYSRKSKADERDYAYNFESKIDEDEEEYEEDYNINEDDIMDSFEPIVEKPVRMESVRTISKSEPIEYNRVQESIQYKKSEPALEDLEEEFEEISSLHNELDVKPVEQELYNPKQDLVLENPAPKRRVEQSKFEFADEDVANSIKSFEEEQEATAIISATELEDRISEMKATGEFEKHEAEIQKYEEEQENKAIISYDELLTRANPGVISYESEESLDGIRVGKVDTAHVNTYSETNEKPYYKEDAFLEAMKEFRRAL